MGLLIGLHPDPANPWPGLIPHLGEIEVPETWIGAQLPDLPDIGAFFQAENSEELVFFIRIPRSFKQFNVLILVAHVVRVNFLDGVFPLLGEE
jgi:hypothetical protein